MPSLRGYAELREDVPISELTPAGQHGIADVSTMPVHGYAELRKDVPISELPGGPGGAQRPPPCGIEEEEECCLYCTEPAGEAGFVPASPCMCIGDMACIHTDCLRADLMRNWRLCCSICKAELCYERKVVNYSMLDRIRLSPSTQLIIVIGTLLWLVLHIVQYAALKHNPKDPLVVWTGMLGTLIGMLGFYFCLMSYSATKYSTVNIKLLSAGSQARAGCEPRLVLLSAKYDMVYSARGQKDFPRALLAFDEAMRAAGRLDAMLAAGAEATNQADRASIMDIEIVEVPPRPVPAPTSNARGDAGVELGAGERSTPATAGVLPVAPAVAELV